jgi:hypothetical protein
VVPTLAKNARMGQPKVVVIHGADAQGWASPLIKIDLLIPHHFREIICAS